MTRTCPRCGSDYPVLRVDDHRCPRCQREVASLIDIDERRRARARWLPKDLTGRAA